MDGAEIERQPAPERRTRRGGSVALVIFAVFWTAGIVAFDFTYLRFVVRQARTAAFARTDGEITASAVTTSRTSEGNKIHGVDLSYTYVVGERTYHGSRYRVSAAQESGSWAADLVRQLPVGARVPVYYAPENPSEAVLRSGLSTAESFPALFIFPFNAAAMGLWWAARQQWRVTRRGDRTGGMRVVDDGDVTRVLPDLPSPAGMALVWAAFWDFVVMIVVAVKFGFEPPAWAVEGATLIVLAFAALGWLRASARQRAGTKELVIDAVARTLRLPREGTAEPPPPISWSAIAGIVLERRLAETEHESSWSYWVSLSRTDGTSVAVGMASWNEREPAERFRVWLAERIGLPSERAIVAASP